MPLRQRRSHSRVEIIPGHTPGGREEVAIPAVAEVLLATTEEDRAEDVEIQGRVVQDMADGPGRLAPVDFVHPLHGAGCLDDGHCLDGDCVAEAFAFAVDYARGEDVGADAVPFAFLDDDAVGGYGL